MGGWAKTKLMLFSTQVEVIVELKLELSLAINGFKAIYVQLVLDQPTGNELGNIWQNKDNILKVFGQYLGNIRTPFVNVSAAGARISSVPFWPLKFLF